MRYTECKASRWLLFGRDSGEFVPPDKLRELAQSFEELATRGDVTPTQIRRLLKRKIDETQSYQPAVFPHILANGSLGMLATDTSLPSFWLGGVTESLRLAIEKPRSSDDALLDALGPPDFASGGILLDADAARAVLKQGKGELPVRARHRVAQASGSAERAIVVTELPYGTHGWDLQAALTNARKAGELPGIKAVKDETSVEHGLRHEMPLTKNADVDDLIKRIDEIPAMTSSVPVSMVVLKDGRPEPSNQADIVRGEADRLVRLSNSRQKAISLLDELRAMEEQPPRTSLRA